MGKLASKCIKREIFNFQLLSVAVMRVHMCVPLSSDDCFTYFILFYFIYLNQYLYGSIQFSIASINGVLI